MKLTRAQKKLKSDKLTYRYPIFVFTPDSDAYSGDICLPVLMLYPNGKPERVYIGDMSLWGMECCWHHRGMSLREQVKAAKHLAKIEGVERYFWEVR